ncbi:MAG TPA: sulfate ABC transporter permease subunit [Thermoanaerobaculia bacterium]|nr:sulfate ABC transporter permease subunit [Thermoanaerobaculia bacterium]
MAERARALEREIAAEASADGRVRPQLAEWAVVGIALFYAVLLLFAPLAALARGALSRGIAAFFREVTTPDALSSLKLTFLLAVGATILNTVFGVATAWLLVRDKKFPGRRIVNGIVDMPFAVSPVIAGFMLIVLFGRTGWFAPVAEALGIKVLFAFPGMLIATTFISLPFVIREIMPLLEQIGEEEENAAYTLGAGRWRAFWSVTLPGIRSGLQYGVLLTFARAVGEVGAVLVVSGSIIGMTETATLFIFRALDERNAVAGYAMALLLALSSFVLLTAMEWIRRRASKDAGAG